MKKLHALYITYDFTFHLEFMRNRQGVVIDTQIAFATTRGEVAVFSVFLCRPPNCSLFQCASSEDYVFDNSPATLVAQHDACGGGVQDFPENGGEAVVHYATLLVSPPCSELQRTP